MLRHDEFFHGRRGPSHLLAVCIFLCLFDSIVCCGQSSNDTVSDSVLGAEQQPVKSNEERWSEASRLIRQVFERVDQNGDLILSLEEYVKAEHGNESDHARRRRDFLVFDFDQNQRLSFREFSAIPGLVEAPFRGSIPNPFKELVDHAVAALDESYDRWDQRPHELISAHSFVGKFLGSIAPMGNQFVTGRVIDLADLNLDGKVSREEAKHFLEQQLGVRLRDGRPLRDATSRVVRYDWFLNVDQDRDGSLTHVEAEAAVGSIPEVLESFDRLDANTDQIIDYQEFSHPIRGCYFDPLVWFRAADVDFSGAIDSAELSVASEPLRPEVLRITFRAFDHNQDLEWSLNEYLLSPLANRNYPWFTQFMDQNGDGVISYSEFTFDSQDIFRLQRRYYFHRMDLDSDGTLAPHECLFSPLRSTLFLESSLQPATLNQLVLDKDAREIGGMSLHPDGSTILFHRLPHPQEKDAEILRISLADRSIKEICKGRLPSWSPTGDSFICERSHRGRGIWLMEADGLSGRKLSDGQSPAWSPDGTAIGYIQGHGIWLYDPSTKKRQQIFHREDHRHRDLGDLLIWSPDSRSLAFIGHSPAVSQLYILRFSTSLIVQSVDQYDLQGSGIELFAWFEGNEVFLRDGVSDQAGTKLRRFDTKTGRQNEVPPDQFYGVNLEETEIFYGRQNQNGSWYLSISED